MFGVYFRTMVLKPQDNQNQIRQRKTLLKELPFKANGLLSDVMQLSFSIPGNINPGAAGDVGHIRQPPDQLKDKRGLSYC